MFKLVCPEAHQAETLNFTNLSGKLSAEGAPGASQVKGWEVWVMPLLVPARSIRTLRTTVSI